MHQDAWLVSPSHPSCRGNVMETLECFQILSAMATHRVMLPPSLPPSLAPCRFCEYQQR